MFHLPHPDPPPTLASTELIFFLSFQFEIVGRRKIKQRKEGRQEWPKPKRNKKNKKKKKIRRKRERRKSGKKRKIKQRPEKVGVNNSWRSDEGSFEGNAKRLLKSRIFLTL